MKSLCYTIQAKGNGILGWSVVQLIAGGCFVNKKLQMKSISNLENYQKQSLLRARSAIMRLPPPTCHALRVGVEPLCARMWHC